MASKGKAAPAAAPERPPTPTGPLQRAVLLVSVDFLASDDIIRSEITKRGFNITFQSLVYLSTEVARSFLTEIRDPRSSHYQQTQPTEDEPNPQTSPRVHEETTDDALHTHALSIAAGPALLLALERPHAVKELQELVGPYDSGLWATASTSLRARLSTQSGVSCTLHERTGHEELAFLRQYTQPPRAGGDNKPRRGSKSDAAVDVDQLLTFLFPPHVQHANSTGRLFVYGLYGPLNAQAQLCAGEKGLHVVTDREVDTMARRMEREDLLAVYHMCSLSQHEEEEVIAQIDNALKSFPRHSKRDIGTLLDKVPRQQTVSGEFLSFHDLQTAILHERMRRVVCMKTRIHPALATPIQNKYRQTLTRLEQITPKHAPPSMFLHDVGLTGAENATLVTRLLSSRAFQICHLDNANSPALTQNVRLLRDDRVHRPLNASRPPWEPNCQRK
ncbi:hypothetical protein Poli38472_004622 [Pythium oligandrum]|uniref:Uncharacterized protein n=1 Tax=Pythium oligandrum TaxID=41045 RepID=A0A8K1CAS7_PYTOL|nr:hypothetical protein Poli38472_004622 [Pythium oligandrum]|eukprot:TMW59553.1 hypothetical protein Poli38472_004622 [Pythium oligandrum]